MKPNLGTFDRAARILLAVAAAVLYFTGVLTGTTGIVVLVLAVVFLLTGMVGSCPLFLPFHINTRKKG